MSVAIALENITRGFSAKDGLVLDRINLEVESGEFVAIVGASGCGKSTLLNVMCDLDRGYSGTFVKEQSASLMFQDSALLPWLTVLENVELPMSINGESKTSRREVAMDLLKKVNLEHSVHKRPHELSGGMRQRVAIARALAQKNKILLMDEPFGALDAITRDVLHDELSDIWLENKLTIVFVTHNVREAVRLGQRVLLMSSRPGTFIREWRVNLPEPRRIDSPEVALLAREITDELRKEIRRHG